MKEEQLIRQCRQGDGKAQKQLYEAYATPMFRICCRYLKDQHEAEDALLKGFQKVFTNLQGFEYRTDKDLAGWIKRIVVNECLMVLRKANNFHLSSLSEDLPILVEEDIYSTLSAEDIYGLILELPNGYRTVFNLYVIEGYSHKEIAEQLQISELTSRSQLSKAKAMLRNLLTKNQLNFAV
ncbi:RNA polymerase sigma factor [Rufibacter roseus]|uniref:RNA polymerase sigma factor n=1 Tax=Rufibacter roseus TaxID=1567108 RepID=A0ABW2DJW0_9BACT|nr:sigma-70 family RNA polymerase sigma factor [Rufibacter roseus]